MFISTPNHKVFSERRTLQRIFSSSSISVHVVCDHLFYRRVSFDVHTTLTVIGVLMQPGRGSGTPCRL